MRRWLSTGSVLLLLAGVLFIALFEPAREEVDAGYGTQARLNRYLAAERLFDSLGAQARTVRGAVELPGPKATVVLLGREPLPTNQDVDSLMAWVSSGGRLVVFPAETEVDPLLEHFGVGVVPSSEPFAAGEGTTGEARGRAGQEASLPGFDGRFRLALDRPPRLTGVEGAELVAHFREGFGEVYVVADGRFLENGSIGDADHARLAWGLVRRPLAEGGYGPVILVARDVAPSLLALLLERFWPAAIAGILLLVAWLLFAGSRFGPVLPAPPTRRRRLLEHVEAAGAFLWDRERDDALVGSCRRAVLSRVERREPGWAKLPREGLVGRLAESAGLGPDQIDQALYGTAPSDAIGFVRCVQTLEIVRRSL